MARKAPEYEFPVTDPFDTLDVLGMEFSIDPYPGLYVDLSCARPGDIFEGINQILRVKDDRLVGMTQTPQKIVFSGHLGCGKSVELKRYHECMNHPERYFSIFIPMEEAIEVAKFEPEDFFILLVSGLAQRIQEAGLPFASSELDALAREWLSDAAIQKEFKEAASSQVSATAGAGVSLWGLLTLKGALKNLLAVQSVTAKTIRERIKTNPVELVRRFNVILGDLRFCLDNEPQGKDILFIFDGTEKIDWDKYKILFIRDAHLIRTIDANCIFSLPISSFYDIQHNPSQAYFHTMTFPMVPIKEATIPILGEVVTKRIDKDCFLEEGVLEYCVKMSGGCIRQLLKIVNKSLLTSLGKKVTMAHAEKAVGELGRQMMEQMTSDHIKQIKSGDYTAADRVVLDLLFSLAILKYNGERKVNPLIAPYL